MTRAEAKIPEHEQISFFREELLAWFYGHGRHFPWRNKSATNYQKVIAEILLQRTQARTVASFFPAFVKRYPSWNRLAQATEAELQEFLKPIGLWRRRAASLYSLALEMGNRRGRFPKTRKDVQALPGVGQYIANAILMFCHGEPQPLLDTSMARVLERYFGPGRLVDIRYDPYLQALAKEVVTCEEPEDANWAILDHAALVCQLKLPLCHSCPVASGCRFAEQNSKLNQT